MSFIEITGVNGDELIVNTARIERVNIRPGGAGTFKVCIDFVPVPGNRLYSEITVDDDGYGQVRALLYPKGTS